MGKKVKRKTTTKAEKAVKKLKFQQKRNQMANYRNNMNEAYNKQMMERQDLLRRATIVEGILNARPEVAVEIEGRLTLNSETVYLNEDDQILYWKADKNPLCAGLDTFESYSLYSPEFFNQVFEFIHKNRPQQEISTTSDIDLGDFDLIEDEEFQEANVVEHPTDELDKDIK
jgi:hypothetical protein